ncbi:hypothetical protein FP2506_08936 [Fulvimarina pelagi HTCC2506]|uniref:Sensory box/GGDEF family protein n=1 Tax=Fulvimarina pelagi HTCC2506 TaxID=314231 RepID=Q0G5V9_9HYPH|nr:EAL domain-containing protein [Fulvimarina pelagi]EAU42955.1 hypothetical protein FP2506_08936 [Fulvimarina pelagi HTCC2506]
MRDLGGGPAGQKIAGRSGRDATDKAEDRRDRPLLGSRKRFRVSIPSVSWLKILLRGDRLLRLVTVAIVCLAALTAGIVMDNQARLQSASDKFDPSASERLINDAFRLTLAVQHDVLNPTEALSDATGLYDRLRTRISQIKMKAASKGLSNYFNHVQSGIRALEPLIDLRLTEPNSIEVYENVYRVAADALQFNALYNEEAQDAVAAEQARLQASFLAIGAIVGIAIGLCVLLVWRIVVQNRRLARAVGLDGLTGIGNRVGFDRHVAGLPKDADCAIILFDLDNFKSINDGLGHHIGDELLRTVASRVREICHDDEFVCRIGGDEFAVVLSGKTAVARGEVACRHILQAIAVPIIIGKQRLDISASVGISKLPSPAGISIESLTRQADAALYAAKNAGRGRYRVYSEELASEPARAEPIHYDIDGAIRSGEIHVEFQPITCLKTGRTLGFESLSRWRHLGLGEIATPEIMPLAENNGAIFDLGLLVLEETCRNAAKWPETYFAAINVSPRELVDPSFLQRVSEIVVRHNIQPQRIEFEIAEPLFSGDEEELLNAIQTLRESGFSAALAKFGAGHSSLASIHHFPFDKIKIDRSLVAASETNERAADIVSLICKFAKSYGIKAGAEGIETLSQAERMREQGCDIGQGLLYDTPLSADDVEKLIREEQETSEKRWESVRLRLLERAA